VRAEDVLRVVELFARASIDVWLDGGWGVDALLGEETRAHRDLDVIVRVGDAGRVREALATAGFREKSRASERNFVLADARGCEVDVHAVEFDARGFGVFCLPDGRRWPFPSSAFLGQGSVAGRRVRCLSPEAQVQCHGQGYAPTEKDLCDMERLQARFGVVLPLILCRQQAPERSGA